MFSVELKINGVLIVHVYGHNEGMVDKDWNTVYTYEVVEIGKGKRLSETITHQRSDGLIALVQKILSEYIDLQGGDD